MKKYNVAVVGATGLVGQKVLEVLEEQNFPVDNLYPLASSRSAGKEVSFNGKNWVVEELTDTSFERDIHIAIFSAGGGTSLKYAPIAAKNNVVVVDNSSAWRMDPQVPLVVPEVNPEDLKNHKNIIANPNCSTIQAVVALKPLHEAYKIKRIVYSTYQAVSGSGVKGFKDLEEGVQGKVNQFYPHQIAYNCIPHIDVFLDNGYTKEEMKMIEETRKILHEPALAITATTVRVPVYYGHSESVNLEFENSFDLKDIRPLLENAPGIVVQDDVANNIYPLARNAEGKNEVFVGRIRRDESVSSGLNIWVVADNIRKGAATNAVQIAELLIQNNLISR
ncbi:aspartate-semialdehyde dehydrogenase [Alkalibacter rhizosphaerae]|uniref:Aspartate-semialdehyde dehydrogenase n=1 Tax=Alkalibacter rhizosphaerae TaxID=2815577 RepID=A0A974XES4_9FIRM|nr:aspartate-semialdehyde dehydrogenase [Alkalibacter rhizosphaerae]QSX08488.1 aspartate-semialdehyde dehydrogenase [Alkalibacter rhizosphaerae]